MLTYLCKSATIARETRFCMHLQNCRAFQTGPMGNALHSLMLVFIAVFISTKKCQAQAQAQKQGKVPALFVFGDSTLDAGNNNARDSPAKCNFPPYGRDFPGHVPTGRFSNGKLVSDFLASSLGIKDLVPAYLDPKTSAQDLPTGVTFASGGAGFDDLTSHNARAITMTQQANYFNECKTRLQGIAGQVEAQRIVNESIYLVGAGSPDIAVSYFSNSMPGSGMRSSQFTLDQYIDLLVTNAVNFTTQLYNSGARKILVGSLSPIGCSPQGRTSTGQFLRPCLERLNEACRAYNQRLTLALSDLKRRLVGSNIVVSDNYNILQNIIANPLGNGFLDVSTSCCGTGLFEAGALCRDAGFSCPNADFTLYWDAVHPSQRGYQLIAQAIARRDLPQLL